MTPRAVPIRENWRRGMPVRFEDRPGRFRGFMGAFALVQMNGECWLRRADFADVETDGEERK